MIIFKGLPLWAKELMVAIFISFVIVVLYSIVIMIFRKNKKLIMKIANIGLAVCAWFVLLYEKLQQGMSEDLQISFYESKFFYIAVVAAIIAVVHAYLNDN